MEKTKLIIIIVITLIMFLLFINFYITYHNKTLVDQKGIALRTLGTNYSDN